MENVFTTFFDLSKKGQENSVNYANSVNCVKPLNYQTLPSKNETEERDGYYERTARPVGKSRITSTRPGLNQYKTPITKMLQRVAMIFAVLVMSMANVGVAWGETVTATYSHSGSSLQPVSFSSNDYFDAMTIATTGTVGGSTTTGARCNITGSSTTTITFTFTAKSDYNIDGFTFASYVNSDDVKNPVITYKKNSNTPTTITPAKVLPKNSEGNTEVTLGSAVSMGDDDVFTIEVSITNSTGTTRMWVVHTITLNVSAAPSCTARTFKSGEKIFFKDASGDISGIGAKWKASWKNIYAYFWNATENAWSEAGDLVSGTWDAANAIYVFTVPGSGNEYTKVLFTRGTSTGWSDIQQTSDQQPCVGENMYVQNTNAAVDGKYNGSWSKYAPTQALIGDFNDWDPDQGKFVDGRVILELEANTDYEFKVLVGDGTNNSNYWSCTACAKATNTVEPWQQLYSNQNNWSMRSAEAGEYCFHWNNDTHYLGIYYPQARLRKNTYIYFDVTRETYWNKAAFDAKFYFKYYDSGSDLAGMPLSCTTPLEDYVYYAVVPNDDYVGRIQMNRYVNSSQDGVADVCYAHSRSSSLQNCMKEETGKENYQNSWTPQWTTYCPPMSSATLSDNSTVKISWQTGDGTSGNPYLVDASGTIKVSASATKAVPDDNMTPNYDFKVSDNGGGASSAQSGTGTTYDKGSLSNNHTYEISLEAWNSYNETNGTKNTSATHIWYKALTTYSVTHTMSGVTKSTGREGSGAAAYHQPYTATYSVSTGYTMPTTITVQFGSTTKTAGTDYTWNSSTGELSILSDKINGNVTVIINGVAKTTAITLEAGEGGTDGSATATYGSSTITDYVAATRTGYTLTKYQDSEGRNILTNTGTLNTGDKGDLIKSSNWAYDGATVTLYAQWEAKEYSITLDRNGASTGSTSVTMTYNSSSHSAFTAPTKDGFTFNGWYDSETDDNGSGNLVMDASGVLQANVTGFTGAGGVWTKDAICTLYAKWTPEATYTVTYNYNGATGGNGTVSNNGNPLPNPSKTGYSFAGWYASDGTFAGAGGATSYVPTADITLYAQWQSTTCAGGGGGSTTLFAWTKGTGADITSDGTSLDGNNMGTMSTGTSIVGKKFGDNDIKNDANGYKLGNNDVAIEIQGTSNFAAGDVVTITGRSNSTNADDYRCFSIAPSTAASARSSDTIQTNKRDNGYSGSDLEYSVAIQSTQAGTKLRVFRLDGKTMHVKAITVTRAGGGGGGTCYYVTYNGNGADGGYTTDEASHASGSNVTVASNSFTRTGYTFTGWKTEPSGGTSYAAGGTISGISGNMTLYAQWEETASTYTLTASATVSNPMTKDSKTGAITGDFTNNPVTEITSGTTTSTSSNTFTVNKGTPVTVTATATIAGTEEQCDECTYVFNSWENIPATVTADVNTIHAVYKTTYTISFKETDESAVAGVSSTSYEYGVGKAASTLPTPSKSGYTFGGWYKENTLTNAATDIDNNDWGNVKYYAKWTPAVVGHTVTYNYNGGTGTPASETAASVTLPTPTRTDYEFDGWYTTAGEKVVDDPYNPTADITLYARWQKACDAGGVSKSTTDVAASGYTTYQEVGGSNVVFTPTPSLGFKYKDADGNTINNSTTSVVRNNAYSCKIQSSSSNKGSIKTNSTFSNVDSISFYFAASDKDGCKIAVWCSTDNFSADSTQLLSATTYAGSNSEFKLKTLAIPPGKKASALTFKFRFTVTGSGKTCYMDSLKVYSSTSGGGTCYHVYYHGNGAESGYVNDTVSYTAGSKATVLNYNYGRYPLAKAGNDFQGWATSASGAVAYTAGQKIDITSADVHLYAVWATASTALVTWEKKVNVTTWTDNSTPVTTDPTNIGSIGSSATLIASPSSTSGKTPQIQLASGASNADKGASFTFSMKSADKVAVPTKVSCEVANVGSESNGDITYKAVLTDGAGNTYYSTNSICPNNNGTLNPIDFVFSSGLSLRGDITVKVYAWLSGSGSGFSFRMGPDVKFYGTVEDYVCADPSAPTISGVSAYVPGETITLTASHDGENYDNLTTYTWYKGADWATASGTTPVQAAATGEDGYIFTKDACAAGDAGKYWCKVSNGTGCDAHNSEGYDVTVYPTYTITYNLNGGDALDGTQKTTYTQMDEDYTLPIPTKAGFVFAGWYENSELTGVPTSILESGSTGNKQYWAKWGSAVTATWTVTKVEDKLYRGGGGYKVTAVIDQVAWDNSFKDGLELTATEGVTLNNIVKDKYTSGSDNGKTYVTADFDITTGLAADATEITFTLSVPADGTYAPAELTEDATLTDCSGGGSTDPYVIGYSNSNATNISSSAANSAYQTASNWLSTGNTDFTEKTSTDGFTISATTASYYWQNDGSFTTSSSGNCRLRTIKMGNGNNPTIRWTNESLAFSKVRIIGRNTSDKEATTLTVSNDDGTTTKTFTFAAGNSAVQTKEVEMDFVSGNTKGIAVTGGTKEINVLIELIPASGGITPTLTWDPALADDGDWSSDDNRLNKETGDVDFTFVAGQDKNSLGAITYSSSNTSVATVNATGTVHIVGAQGDATITATLAASGCFEEATATYNIHVEDNCIDEPGTITSRDLGCDGTELTVSGHTATASVSYQWYKDGVSLGGSYTNPTCTVTVAGEYYVVVDNSAADGDHCAMASTNTVKVASKAAATATKIVDSWYVKNGRRTPDVALVQTTGATDFIVKNGETIIWESAGSTKTGFGGCGFHMGTDGIIYLNGTKDDGDATTGLTADDVTLKITANDGCGSSASELSITIHCQEATTYKEIAFVADGGKGMKKDSITVGHGDGTELYEYLDSVGTAAGNRLFQLSERNIYWTTDEKAIREEYSQFDGILITDDPSTNTVVKKGDDYKTKGYVNAFGTMVDVRPIFTMEAYVSALKNWGAKGIAGNPESPNPRQYEMRLECKDHEIYGAGLPDPEDGTNVWEETIGGETFRHVILVDSTLGIYKGVKYNKETKGNEKPALQGFTGEAAGSLLGLGRILEGTLQAAIERQEEPAARLLVMGINAKALQPTCALTDEGKTVIKNILVYLLKTNMEEVDDCSNYFTGKNSSDWNNASNWSKNQLPSSEAKVRILAPCVISGIQPHVAQVAIVSSGESSIRGTNRGGDKTCDGRLTINADGALIVDGKVLAAQAPHFAANDLMPTAVTDLIINTSASGQAALIFNNDEGLTKATVNYYSLGRKISDDYQYQYFAVPMEYVSVNPTFANENHGGTKIYTYAYEDGGWTRRGYYDDLFAFEGLGLTTSSTADHMSYTMTGTLASTATQEISLSTAGDGYNLVGNSWMAPIQIAALSEDNTDANITKTAYIYCTGHDGGTGSTNTEGAETAGQWIPIPFEASGTAGWRSAGKLSVVPAMQAFQIKTEADATLTMDYSKVVRGSDNSLTEKMRAPKRVAAHTGTDMTIIRVSDTKTYTDVCLFEGEQFSEAFDNGWEAEYMEGDGRSAQFYAMNGADKMAVLATDELEGTPVCFVPGKESNYTISFFGGDGRYYLNDLKEEKSTLMEQGNTYSFSYEEGDMPHRFLISITPFGVPSVTTGCGTVEAQEKAQKIIYNDHVYIIRGGKIYDVMGKMMK